MAKHEDFTFSRLNREAFYTKCPDEKTQVIRWDNESKGLGIRITRSGKRSFIFERQLNGETIRLTIHAELPETVTQKDIDAARDTANEYRKQVSDGLDPRAVIRQKQEKKEAEEREQDAKERRETITVREVWSAYVEDRHKARKDGKPLWGDRQRQHHASFTKPGGEPWTRGRRPGQPATTRPGILVPLMDIRMADLTHKRVLEWFRTESERAPTLAAQALRGLRAFVGWAAAQDEFASIADATACNHRTIKDEEPQQKPKEGDVLREAYLPLWFEQVRKLNNPVQGSYLQIALLTGARRNELAALKWADVDFRFKTMEIRDKVEGRRIIPLTDYTAHIIQQLPRRNEYVFSADSKSGRLEEPRASHDRVLNAAGLPHVSIHGLRRSFVTLAENAEVPAGVVMQLAGHKPSGVHEANYKRRDIDTLTRWHQKIENWFLEQAGITFEPVQSGLRVVAGGNSRT